MCSRCSSRKWTAVIVDWSLMTKDVPPEFHHDLDYLISMLDWEANVNPEFAKSNKRHPVPVRPIEQMEECGYREKWITYGGKYYSAKELTVSARAHRNHQRRGCLRIDSHPGVRLLRRPLGIDAFHDSLWRTYRGRVIRHGLRRA